MKNRITHTSIFSVLLGAVIGTACTVGDGAGIVAPDSGPRGSDVPPDVSPYVPTDAPDRFHAGQPFSIDAIPYPVSADLSAQLQGYAAITGFKALAMNPNGDGFISASTDPGCPRCKTRPDFGPFANQAEASRTAVEACQVVAGDQPCAVFAEGDTIKYDEPAFLASLVEPLEHGARAFDASTLPFASDALRAEVGYSYAKLTDTYKAVAVSIYGAAWISENQGATSQADADRVALQDCEGSTRGQPCTLYAETDQVVFNVTTLAINTTSAIDYAPNGLDFTKIPFLSTSSQQTIATAYAQHPVSGSSHNAIAIAFDGTSFVCYGATVNSTSTCTAYALAQCNPVTSADGEGNVCFLFANDNTYTMTKSDVVN